jgi:hypothetical protein
MACVATRQIACPLPFTCTKTASQENACWVLFGHVLSKHETVFVEVWALQMHAHVRTRADKTRYNKPWQNKADATSEYETNTQKTRQGGGFEFDRFESPAPPTTTTKPPTPHHRTASHHPKKWDLKRKNESKTTTMSPIALFNSESRPQILYSSNHFM